MKTLIEKSIELYGMGHPDVKTVFKLNAIPVLSEDATDKEIEEIEGKKTENEKILKDTRFKSLVTISGRKLSAFFDYEEDEVKKSDKLQLTIPKTDDESEIKDFILQSINSHLN